MTLTNDHHQPAAAAAAAVPPKTDKDTGYEGWDNLGKWDVLSGDQWSSLRGQLDVIMLLLNTVNKQLDRVTELSAASRVNNPRSLLLLCSSPLWSGAVQV